MTLTSTLSPTPPHTHHHCPTHHPSHHPTQRPTYHPTHHPILACKLTRRSFGIERRRIEMANASISIEKHLRAHLVRRSAELYERRQLIPSERQGRCQGCGLLFDIDQLGAHAVLRLHLRS